MNRLWIRSLEVETFRQYRKPVLVNGIGRDLTVLAGENEIGKSTLLAALEAAFFERWKSAPSIESFRPYESEASPRVAVSFSLGETEYRLEKIFSQRAEGGMSLVCGDGQRWEGERAEKQLEELLDFEHSPKGRSKPEHHGVTGTLWIHQGDAWKPVQPNARSQTALGQMFDAEMTDLLGGEHGEALRRRVQALRDGYLTKTGKLRKEYQDQVDELEACRNERAGAQRRLAEFEQQVDQLSRLRRSLREFTKKALIERAREKHQAARARKSEVQALERRAEQAREALRSAEAELKLGRRELAERQELVEGVESGRKELQGLREQLAPLDGEIAEREKTLREAEEALKAARGEQETARKETQRAHRAVRAREISEKLSALEDRHARARAAAESRAKAREALGKIRVEPEGLVELESLERDLRVERERLKAVATELAYEITGSRRVSLDGERLQGEGNLSVTGESRLEIDGAGSIRIRAGQANTGEIEASLRSLEARRTELLERMAAPDAATARQLLERRRSAERELDHQDERLATYAPGGLEELEAQLSETRAELKAPEADGVNRDPPPDMQAAEEALSSAEESVAARLQQQEASAGAFQDVRERSSKLRARVGVLDEKQQEREAQLAQARDAEPDRELARRVAELEREVDEKKKSLATASGAHEASAPAEVAAEVERTEKALQELKAEKERLEREQHGLERELRAAGRDGLAETVGDLDVKYRHLEAEVAQIRARAHAVDLLHVTLEAARADADEAIVRPVVERMQPYIRQLLPGARPVVSPELGLTGILRDGRKEGFESLSIGTREQLAVLMRLAYADLLTEAGVPVAVILDDALAASDDQRRERMKQILFQAAKKFQVIVFTCHAGAYRDTGGQFIDLETSLPGSTGNA